ncbi:DUF4011 domain-containing protein [Streptomyces sp. CB01881]|uniref:DUF4011 domain-containing protein n=1 Tax=Streptomyces sp. CB01881 TaxID=2078691 RepID=UPI000CDC12AB|nr:DUF4011 domain-containing protein [Streptomyces sp. CB01881]AUY52918.1 regulator [Streptomyces sp. CB01881]TYC70635.1 DUF4011 domain-containing protein [Streptomyces sp. CB01881]
MTVRRPADVVRLEKQLKEWRDSLIDLSFRNRLLSYQRRETSSGMDLVEPGLLGVLDGLKGGFRFKRVPEPEEDADDRGPGVRTAPPSLAKRLDGARPIDTPASRSGAGGARERLELVTSKTTQTQQDNHLRRLATVAREKYNDYGLWVLHLGVGFLDWRPGPTAVKAMSSPLVMVPVVLERHRADTYLLRLNPDEEPVLNPALGIKMAELEVDWPRPEQIELGDVPELLTRVRDAVGDIHGWRFTGRVVLDTFNSSKEVMYRDLLDNQARILGSPLVRALGGVTGSVPAGAFDFDPVDTDRIDVVQPPEQAPLVLDADSSQRQCVAAAVDGRSFVMDGPPGTGKSQTITNMIAGLLEEGRTVLFVSEKAAALDVVRNRLQDVGLHHYVLSLHSNSAGRKQVAQELGGALGAARRTVPGADRAELDRARRLREELSGYAAAMNEQHPGLGSSLHDTLGRLAQLESVPSLPVARGFGGAAFTAEAYGRVLDAAGRVARSWRPATEGEAFSWYGLTPGADPLRTLDLADEALTRLARAVRPHEPLLGALGWEGLRDAGRLTELLRTAGRRPGVPAHWLTTGPDVPQEAVAAFRRRLDELDATEAPALAALGSRWEELPPQTEREAELDALLAGVAGLDPAGIDPAALDAAGARALADRLERDAELLDDVRRSMTTVAAVYGVPAPSGRAEAARLAVLARCAGTPDERKPPAGWLTPAGLTAAREAVAGLSARVAALVAARRGATSWFTDAVLGFEALADLAGRFAAVHNSFTGRFSSACRADRKQLRTLLPEGAKVTKAVIQALPAAVAWQAADRAFADEARARSAVLGGHWNGEQTDFAALAELLAHAGTVLEAAPDVHDRAAFTRELAAGGSPRQQARTAAEGAAQRLAAWCDALVLPPEVGPSIELEAGPLADAEQWSRAQSAPLRAAADLITAVEQVLARGAGHPVTEAGRPAPGARPGMTLAAAREAIRAVVAARAAARAFEESAAADRTALGGLYQGRGTRREDLQTALDWAADLRSACGLGRRDRLPEAAVGPVMEAGPDAELAAAVTGWATAAQGLTDRFRAERAGLLGAAFTSGFDAAVAALDVLDADRGGPDEWWAYDEGRQELDRLGLGDLVDRAVRREVRPEEFPDVVERAALQSWVDQQLAGDSRLGLTRSVDRDDQVTRFRELDAALAGHARSRVVQACESRRPRTATSPGAMLLKREGEKKTRHKPVRQLLDDARETVRQIKPCFMMSPLTVSRFLPPDFDFDVVIFDEASQVLPQDAVNCIYRGRSLIVAGDQKQLPPTAFFSAGSEDEDDEFDEEEPERFASVLDLCKASGFLPSLSLRWHYRSRHESLIAFSNREFYEDSMTTFPGAHAEGDDVGVAYFLAERGVYRPGSAARNNPGEAEEVARRVIHHFTTRPGRSLGVVALSQPQALAIQEAVHKARRTRPDLDACFSDDRLDGFFVKNLETVQGDERDVMIMSVGYGPDPTTGRLSMNFGPMNRADGWKRLNVAVTRARYRVEVVASFDPGQMRDTGSKSLRHLKRYLEYAQNGPAALAAGRVDEDAVTESPFEESVLGVLRDWGYDVQPQVGVAGYRIDLGIRHPHAPGRYALGVECDGAMYHSSRAARDRDRLRDGVLRGLGWELHRIWGTDWYRDRSGAEARLRAAVRRAVETPLPRVPRPRPAQASAADPVGTVAPPRPADGPASVDPASVGLASGSPVSGTAAPGRAPRPSTATATGKSAAAKPATAAPAEPMPTAYPVADLPPAAWQRIRLELAGIHYELGLPPSADPSADHRARSDNRRGRDRRNELLEQRRDFLLDFADAVRPRADAVVPPVVAPGRLVALVLEGEQEVEEYEITSQTSDHPGRPEISPFSELGAALLWRREGERVEYTDGTGRRRSCLVRGVRD